MLKVNHPKKVDATLHRNVGGFYNEKFVMSIWILINGYLAILKVAAERLDRLPALLMPNYTEARIELKAHRGSCSVLAYQNYLVLASG